MYMCTTLWVGILKVILRSTDFLILSDFNPNKGYEEEKDIEAYLAKQCARDCAYRGSSHAATVVKAAKSRRNPKFLLEFYGCRLLAVVIALPCLVTKTD